MVVVARLLDIPQAQVAASALRSAGLHPVLFDEFQNQANWVNMYAIGGCRVAVPETEAEDAVAILDQPFEPEARLIDRTGWGWRCLAGVLGVGLLTPELGWLVLGVRSRCRGTGGGVMGFAVAAVGTALIFATALVVTVWLERLLSPVGLG